MLPAPKSAVDCVSPAFDTAKNMMFKPFQWSRWWRVALLGLATGEAASSGSCNFNIPSDLANLGKTQPQPEQFLQSSSPIWQGFSTGQIAGLVTILVVLVVMLVLVHLYIGSVLRFVLFDAVTRGRFRIREGWKRWHDQGVSYFRFQLGLLAVSLMGYGVLMGLPLAIAWSTGLFQNAKEHWGMIALMVLVCLPLVIAFAVTIAVVMVLFKDFGVPMMAVENLSSSAAWERLRGMMKPVKGDYAIYIVMKIVLGLAAAIAMGIVQFIVFLVPIIILVAVAVGVVAAVPDIIKNPAGLAFVITTVVVVAFIMVFIAAILAAPVVVFFQSYVLQFFSSRYEPLWKWLYPAPDMPEPPAIPPPEPLPAM